MHWPLVVSDHHGTVALLSFKFVLFLHLVVQSEAKEDTKHCVNEEDNADQGEKDLSTLDIVRQFFKGVCKLRVGIQIVNIPECLRGNESKGAEA